MLGAILWHRFGELVVHVITDSFGSFFFQLCDRSDDFSFEKKSVLDLANPKVQEWEKMMAKYQQALPWENPDDPWKWKPMNRVFAFNG